MKNNPTYGDARICKNCRHGEIRNHSNYCVNPGYYCTLFNSRCCKTKVCKHHEYDGEHDGDFKQIVADAMNEIKTSIS